MDAEAQAAFDRAWRHFQLHAEQRIAVFNFFVASAGLLLTGLAYVLAGPSTLSVLGIAAGAMIAMLACVFWKLDERSAQIIKVSESEIERLERASTSGPAVFSAVSHLPVSTSAWNVRGVWTFGRSFRLMFLAVALLGVSGMAVSIWRSLKPTSDKVAPRPVPKPTSTPPRIAAPAPRSSVSSRAASVPHPRRSGSPVRMCASSDRELRRKSNPAPTGHVAPTLVPVTESLRTAEPNH